MLRLCFFFCKEKSEKRSNFSVKHEQENLSEG